jgi:hypothetical protein
MSSAEIPSELRAKYAAAAEHAAAEAPEVRPGDEIALQLRRLYPDFRACLAEHRAAQNPQESGTAA